MIGTMEFGRLPSVDSVDFRLPRDSGTKSVGPPIEPGALDLRIGLAGWADTGFRGTLYPASTRQPDFLAVHAQAFPTTELNSTYYGYTKERLARWGAAVPDSFAFCPKLPATITHERGLGQASEDMARFVEATDELGSKRGVVWGVLPPDFTPNDAPVLDAFLAEWGPRVPLALEVRHRAWFSDSPAAARGFAAFERRGAVPILCDVAGRRDALHMRVVASSVFIRLVGNHPHPSDGRRARDWVQRLESWCARGVRQAWVFVHQRVDPDAVPLAREIADLWRARTGQDPLPGLREPLIPPGGLQGELF